MIPFNKLPDYKDLINGVISHRQPPTKAMHAVTTHREQFGYSDKKFSALIASKMI